MLKKAFNKAQGAVATAKLAVSKPFNKASMTLTAMFCFVSTQAMAFEAPTGDELNTMGGQAYDLIFNQAYDSGLGYIIAGGLIVWGLMGLKTDWKDSAYKGVGGAGVAGLPSILTAFGVSVI